MLMMKKIFLSLKSNTTRKTKIFFTLFFFISYAFFNILSFNSKVLAISDQNINIKDLKICADDITKNDLFFGELEQKGLITSTQTCENEANLQYESYWRNWTNDLNYIPSEKTSNGFDRIKAEVKLLIRDQFNSKESIDTFFDTVFDRYKKPVMFSEFPNNLEDSYFVALLSMNTFFYIKDTRYIHIGKLQNLNSFKKMLLKSYLNFIDQSGNIIYPILDKGNGDPWLEFQKDKKYENPPDVVGIIGNTFAMFGNLTNETKEISLTELNNLKNNFLLYSNLNLLTPINYSGEKITLKPKEAIFITSQNLTNTPNTTISPTTPTQQAPQQPLSQAYLEFEKLSIYVSPNKTYTIKLLINSPIAEITGADAILKFDPNIIEVTKISPGNFFDDHNYTIAGDTIQINGIIQNIGVGKKGRGVFAFITIKPKSKTETKIEIVCDPNQILTSGTYTQVGVEQENILNCETLLPLIINKTDNSISGLFSTISNFLSQNNNKCDLTQYFILTLIYITLLQFGVVMKKAFYTLTIIGIFFLSGIIGIIINNCLAGFILGVVLSFILY